MEFKVNSGAWGSMFGVPCVVADNLLKMASGEQIKVLLYILRHSSTECSYEEVSANTGVSLTKTQEAVNFWKQANILTSGIPAENEENIQLDFFSTEPPAVQQPVLQQTAVQKPDLQQNATETVPENPPEQKKIIPPEPKQRHWTGSEILKLKMESSDIAELLNAVQSVLGHMNHMQSENIVNMHEDLGMSKEVIMTLVGYCKSINKTYPRYIYEMAYQWTRDSIVTQEQAEQEIQRLSQYNEYKYKVMRAIDIDRVSEKQAQLIECWRNWNIAVEMVKYAYELTLDNQKRNIFAYMNGIIKRWYENGITTLHDAQNSDELHKKENTRKYNKKNDKKNDKKDSDFNEDMYDIFVNNFEVLKNEI